MKSKTIIVTMVLAALILIAIGVRGAFAYFSDSAPSTGNVARVINDWYNLDWAWRKPVTISSSSSLSNFQVRMSVNTNELVTANKMQSQGQDIRFTSQDGTTNLLYWIESGMNTTATIIWVRVPSLSPGNNTIYMYYGNPGAAAASSGYAPMFIFFDSFEDSLSRWTRVNSGQGTATQVSNWATQGSYSVYLNKTGTTNTFGVFCAVSPAQTSTFIIEYDARPVQTNLIWEMQGTSAATVGPALRFNSDATIEYKDNTGWHDFATPMAYTAGSTYSFKLVANAGGSPNDTYTIYINSVLKASNVRFATNLASIGRFYFIATTTTQTPKMWVDWVRMRAYAATEPTVTAIGSEQSTGMRRWRAGGH